MLGGGLLLGGIVAGAAYAKWGFGPRMFAGVGFALLAMAVTRMVGHVRKLRASFWWVSSAAGAAFAILSSMTERLPAHQLTIEPTQNVIRYTAQGTGVLFLLGILSALLPTILDAFERRTFTYFVGARHVRATKSGFLTVISVLSMAGVAVSSCALCSVTSIMGGFGHDLKRKILGNNAHVVVDVRTPGGFSKWEEKLEVVSGAIAAQGATATPVVAGDAMGSSATNTAGTLVRGIDPETIGSVIDLKDNIEVGKFDYFLEPEHLVQLPPDEIIGRGPGGDPYYKGPDFRAPDVDATVSQFLKNRRKVYPGIIVGRELAKSLHVLVGDEVTLLSPMGELGPMGVMPRSRKFRVAAIFYTGMYEYDASHAYIQLDEAQKFFSLDDNITHIDIRVPEPEKVDEYRPNIQAAVEPWVQDGGEDPALRVRDWKEMNKNLFSALQLEKIASFIILCIAIIVASFCIICTLLLMVTEKGKEIAILKALGASDRAIMSIFIFEGVVIGSIGTLFGVITALATMSELAWFGIPLDPDVYYIDRLPVNVNPADYVAVTIAALVICTLATIYPAHAASKLHPVDGLRYE